jgi:hypothetical protein
VRRPIPGGWVADAQIDTTSTPRTRMMPKIAAQRRNWDSKKSHRQTKESSTRLMHHRLLQARTAWCWGEVKQSPGCAADSFNVWARLRTPSGVTLGVSGHIAAETTGEKKNKNTGRSHGTRRSR